MPRSPDAQMPRCPDAQKPRCPDAQKPRCPDAQKPRCPEAQMPRCPDAQKPRCPEAQMPRSPDAQKPKFFAKKSTSPPLSNTYFKDKLKKKEKNPDQPPSPPTSTPKIETTRKGEIRHLTPLPTYYSCFINNCVKRLPDLAQLKNHIKTCHNEYLNTQEGSNELTKILRRIGKNQDLMKKCQEERIKEPQIKELISEERKERLRLLNEERKFKKQIEIEEKGAIVQNLTNNVQNQIQSRCQNRTHSGNLSGNHQVFSPGQHHTPPTYLNTSSKMLNVNSPNPLKRACPGDMNGLPLSKKTKVSPGMAFSPGNWLGVCQINEIIMHPTIMIIHMLRAII